MAIPTFWRTKKQRYSLEGEKCPACSQAVFPPRKVCPYCGGAMDGSGQHLHGQAPLFSVAYQMPQAMTIRVAGDD